MKIIKTWKNREGPSGWGCVGEKERKRVVLSESSQGVSGRKCLRVSICGTVWVYKNFSCMMLIYSRERGSIGSVCGVVRVWSLGSQKWARDSGNSIRPRICLLRSRGFFSRKPNTSKPLSVSVSLPLPSPKENGIVVVVLVVYLSISIYLSIHPPSHSHAFFPSPNTL